MDPSLKHHLILRADANSRSGTGHMMRCFALAQHWQRSGGAITFLSHCESDSLRHRIESAGMRFIDIMHPHPDQTDLATTLSELAEHGGLGDKTWLVLDGYHFDSKYQKAIRRAGHALLIIDDLAHQDFYHADVLLNQNITGHNLTYRCDIDTLLLLGPRYALLRQEFLSWRGSRRQTSPIAQRILVTLGGSDPDNVTERIIEALKLLDHPFIEARIIAGAANQHLPRLEQAISKSGSQLQLIYDTSDMPELMAWADLAISAAGSTCWELAFMGVPSLLIVLADNQRALADNLATQGAAVLLGESDEIMPHKLLSPLRALIQDQNQRDVLSARSRRMVDGQGAERVVAALWK